MDEYEERRRRGVREGECGVSDGRSFCTEPAGHGGSTHWDKILQHEWDKEDDDHGVG